MPKEFEVSGTVYEFPDSFSDQKVQEILTKQGVIKAKNKPRSFLEGVSQGMTLNEVQGEKPPEHELFRIGGELKRGELRGPLGEAAGIVVAPLLGKFLPKAIGGVVKAGTRAVTNPATNGLVKEAVGVISPRAKHAIDLMGRLKRLTDALNPSEEFAPYKPTAPTSRGQGVYGGGAGGTKPNPKLVTGTGPKRLPSSAKEKLPTLKAEAPTQEPAMERAYPNPENTPETGAKVSQGHYQAAARTVKAKALARYLKIGNIPLEDAKLMNAEHWEMAATGAGVTKPSEFTVKQVLSELERLYSPK